MTVIERSHRDYYILVGGHRMKKVGNHFLNSLRGLWVVYIYCLLKKKNANLKHEHSRSFNSLWRFLKWKKYIPSVIPNIQVYHYSTVIIVIIALQLFFFLIHNLPDTNRVLFQSTHTTFRFASHMRFDKTDLPSRSVWHGDQHATATHHLPGIQQLVGHPWGSRAVVGEIRVLQPWNIRTLLCDTLL